MNKYGDPSWAYHTACAKVLALTTAYLSEKPVVGFSALDYADGLEKYVDAVKDTALRSNMGFVLPSSIQQRGNDDDRVDGELLRSLDKAVKKFRRSAKKLDKWADKVRGELSEDFPWWKPWKRVPLYIQAHIINKKLMYLERKFLHEEGLDGRDWFKHVIFAPGLWTGYSGAVFPGLTESLESGDYLNAKRWEKIIRGKITDAANSLRKGRHGRKHHKHHPPGWFAPPPPPPPPEDDLD
ncbi:hypothetical protein KEM55_007272 [Ascosphaera atra]|nr:hypothetical protein KEM55_007272 [Ascosphaera atra]